MLICLHSKTLTCEQGLEMREAIKDVFGCALNHFSSRGLVV